MSDAPVIFEPDRYFRWKDIQSRVPIPRSTWYQRVAEGVIPMGERLSPHIVAWRGAVLNEALASMAALYAGVRFGPKPKT